MLSLYGKLFRIMIFSVCVCNCWAGRRHYTRFTRSSKVGEDPTMIINSVEHIWDSTTVAVGDTAVLHCSFDALFQQLPHGNIDWLREPWTRESATDSVVTDAEADSNTIAVPTIIAAGKATMIADRRYRVYRPHNSALSVLIIRRARKHDSGVYRCNLSGSSTRQKYLVLNVTDSKIEAETSPTRTRVKVDGEVTLWCNASGYPPPVVYWSRQDQRRQLQDGSHQYWGNGLHIRASTQGDSGVYVCHLDNFVQPVVSYKFSLFVEDNPWRLDAYKMRYDSKYWFPSSVPLPAPYVNKSYLLMCEVRGSVRPTPSITWYIGGRQITPGKHFYIITDSTAWKQRFISSTLVIMRYSTSFQGRYTCVANNGFRVKRQTFRLRAAKMSTKAPRVTTLAVTESWSTDIITTSPSTERSNAVRSRQ